MAEVPQPLFPELLSEFTYLRSDIDALLATKQSSILKRLVIGITATASSLLYASDLNKFVRVDTFPGKANDTLVLNLPTPAVADLGKVLVVHHYSGTTDSCNLQLQAKLGNDAVATAIEPVIIRGTRMLLQIVPLERGTPNNDTVPAYEVIATSAEGQLTLAQVKSLLPLSAPVVTYDGSTAVGYATLDAALAAAGSKITLTGATVSVNTTNTTAKTRPSLIYAAGASVSVASGASFRVRGLLADAYLSGDGALLLVGGGPDAYYSAILASSEANLTVTVPASAYATIKDSYVKLLNGAGTVYLYGNTVVGTIDTTGGLTVIDRRPAGGSKLDVKLATQLAQQDSLPPASDYTVPFSQVLKNNGPSSAADLNAHTIVVPTDMRALVMISVILKNVTLGGFYQVAIAVKNAAGQVRIISLALAPTASANGDPNNASACLCMYAATAKDTFAAGDQIRVSIYMGSQVTANLRGQYDNQWCTMQLIQD